MYLPETLEKFLFIDIETVHVTETYEALSTTMQKQWQRRMKRIIEEGISAEDAFYQNAGIAAEFAKVVCVTCGVLRFESDGSAKIITKSYAGDDEKELLLQIREVFDKHFQNGNGKDSLKYICGHNIREFDMPFLGRRSLIHGIHPLPNALQISGKKPWEVKFIVDTMELWRFGDYKSFTSLELLTAILDIPTPKNDINGSQVSVVYWQDKDLPRITKYCEADVAATIQVMLRFCGLPLATAINSTTDAKESK